VSEAPHIAFRLKALANGYEPIPVIGKAPPHKGWSEGEITEGRLAEMDAAIPGCTNTGLRTGHIAAIDIDLTSVAHTFEVEKTISAMLGETLLRRVGSKGALLCYRNETPIPKITIGTKNKRLVEILGAGQQFVADGTHPDTGRPYEWTNDWMCGEPLQTPAAELPEVTPAKLQEVANAVAAQLSALGYGDVAVTGIKPPREETAAPIPSGKPASPALVDAMLRCIKPAIVRAGWLTVCGGLVNAPVSDVAWDGLDVFRRWSAGEYHDGPPANYQGAVDCEAQWDRDADRGDDVPAFGALVNLAREHGYQGPSHSESASETFKDFLEQQTKADASDGPEPISELLGRTVGPVEEVIAGLVERGVPTFFAGPGGSNKSRVGLHWGLSIDAKARIYGRAVMPATFVYVSAEDHHDEVARRAQAITRRLKLPAGGTGRYWDRVGKDSAIAIMSEGGAYELTPFYGELTALLRSIEGHKFVVLDSTYNFVRFQGKAKIDEGAVNAFVALLQRICFEGDATLLMLWHPSQSGQERGDASGWSVAWHNAPRARLSITPVKDSEDAFTLKVEKRNHGAKGPALTLHWSDGVLLPRAESNIAEHEAAFRKSVVRVATMAAECGAPIQKQPRLQKWQLDEIERDIGRRPCDRDVKEVLAACLPVGLLRYIGGSQHRTAGYYPADEQRALELAIAAKRGAVHGGEHV
jgi:RecA-family ATPase